LCFYLNHLLHFLRADISPDQMEPVPLAKIARDERWLLGEVSSDYLDISFRADCSESETILGDPLFLAAAVKEMLRNADKAVFRRQEKETLEERETCRGGIELALSRRGGTAQIKSPHLCLEAQDDGDATVDKAARRRLKELWDKTLQGADYRQTDQLGLIFMNWVARKHGGLIELDSDSGKTVFRLLLPVHPTGKDG